jgi:hypothetical protein
VPRTCVRYGGLTLYTQNYALVEIRKADGTVLRVSPPWVQAITVEDSSRRAQNTTLKGEVVRYESVTTHVGPLMAFKITISLAGKLYQEFWYAPEARTAVRLTQYDGRGNAVTSELIDYQRSEDAESPLTQK